MLVFGTQQVRAGAKRVTFDRLYRLHAVGVLQMEVLVAGGQQCSWGKIVFFFILLRLIGRVDRV